ncbi:MAG: hypothetical protein H6713_32655 [Myxococcales bacterium]|nr:hypothetical protein [Myxococcales bacterium]
MSSAQALVGALERAQPGPGHGRGDRATRELEPARELIDGRRDVPRGRELELEAVLEVHERVVEVDLAHVEGRARRRGAGLGEHAAAELERALGRAALDVIQQPVLQEREPAEGVVGVLLGQSLGALDDRVGARVLAERREDRGLVRQQGVADQRDAAVVADLDAVEAAPDPQQRLAVVAAHHGVPGHVAGAVDVVERVEPAREADAVAALQRPRRRRGRVQATAVLVRAQELAGEVRRDGLVAARERERARLGDGLGDRDRLAGDRARGRGSPEQREDGRVHRERGRELR